MKGIKYNVEISEGFMAWSHGISQMIEEYYIPEYGIVFNLHSPGLNAFREEEPRDNLNVEDVEIMDTFAELLKRYVETKEEILKEVEAERVKLE